MNLSQQQARKLILLCQGIHKEARFGGGSKGTLKAIEQLGYIQIDTISVVERAHHHTVWNRVPTYQIEHLNQLAKEQQVFEYWSHAAAYLPMRDYRFSLPRKHAIKSGAHRHWHAKDKKLMQLVLKRIRDEGPLQAKDFEQKRPTKNTGWWDWKPAKKALEQLFMEGDLMVTKRQGFQKVYDLSERVLPANCDTRSPSEAAFHEHLILRYLCANGIGTAAEISYLRKGIKASVQQRCEQLHEDGKLIHVTVGNDNTQDYYALPTIEETLAQSLSRSKVKILSPFDNLLIQRKRTKALFNFDYQIECYVPAAKRQYGYFSLPILWGQNLVGRMDSKIDRKTGILHILNLAIEEDNIGKRKSEFNQALQASLQDFLHFNKGNQIVMS